MMKAVTETHKRRKKGSVHSCAGHNQLKWHHFLSISFPLSLSLSPSLSLPLPLSFSLSLTLNVENKPVEVVIVTWRTGTAAALAWTRGRVVEVSSKATCGGWSVSWTTRACAGMQM
jgi:hypothetical protein